MRVPRKIDRVNRRRALVEGAIIGFGLLAVAGCGGGETVEVPPSTEAATPGAKSGSGPAGAPKATGVATARSGAKVPVSSRRQRQKEKAGKSTP
jgi:hypothetical protein